MNSKKVFAWVLFLGCLALIFFFSSQNGNDSSATSNVVLKILNDFLKIPYQNWESLLIRKIAHFSIYLILAIVTLNLLKQYTKLSKRQIIMALIFCLLYAISDEFHQSFIGGRSPEVTDVLIDFAGSIIGSLIYWYFLDKFIKKRNNTFI